MALGKFLVMVLKNRSNEILSNEIRIRWELPVRATNSEINFLSNGHST